MSALVIYPHPNDKTGTRFKVVKGKLNGKPNRWLVTVWFNVPEEVLEQLTVLADGRQEKNPRSMTFRPSRPCMISEISHFIDGHLEEQQAIVGTVRWQALQER